MLRVRASVLSALVASLSLPLPGPASIAFGFEDRPQGWELASPSRLLTYTKEIG